MTLKTISAHSTRPLSTGATETLQIPVYQRIQDVILSFDGTEAEIRAEIGLIRLSINGSDIINLTAAELYDLYEMLGVKVFNAGGTAGALSLNLAPLVYNNPAIRDQFGWGELGVTNIQVSVTALTLSAVSSVRAFTVRDTPRDATGKPVKQTLGAHVKAVRYQQNFNATGEHTVDTLPRDLGTAYLMVAASDGASGAITSGRCSVNSVNIYDDTPLAINGLYMSRSGYDQIGGYYVFNFVDGGLNSRLPMEGVTDLRFVQTFGTAPGAGGYAMLSVMAVDFPANITT